MPRPRQSGQRRANREHLDRAGRRRPELGPDSSLLTSQCDVPVIRGRRARRRARRRLQGRQGCYRPGKAPVPASGRPGSARPWPRATRDHRVSTRPLRWMKASGRMPLVVRKVAVVGDRTPLRSAAVRTSTWSTWPPTPSGASRRCRSRAHQPLDEIARILQRTGISGGDAAGSEVQPVDRIDMRGAQAAGCAHHVPLPDRADGGTCASVSPAWTQVIPCGSSTARSSARRCRYSAWAIVGARPGCRYRRADRVYGAPAGLGEERRDGHRDAAGSVDHSAAAGEHRVVEVRGQHDKGQQLARSLRSARSLAWRITFRL